MISEEAFMLLPDGWEIRVRSVGNIWVVSAHDEDGVTMYGASHVEIDVAFDLLTLDIQTGK